MLESKELTKKFGFQLAVNRVTLAMEAGHVYAMLGPNGSGKTTWMKMAAGLVKPTEGTVLFEGKPVDVESRRHIAYMSTEPYFYTWMTADDVGAYYADFFEDFSISRYNSMLADMQLEGSMKIKSMSSGMAAKLKVAATMARNARVYMLDEPFNGIDLLARDQIRNCILQAAGSDKLLLLSTHLVEEMEAIADRAVYIRDGKLMEVCDLETMREEEGKSMAQRYREIFGGEAQTK